MSDSVSDSGETSMNKNMGSMLTEFTVYAGGYLLNK